MSFWRNKYLLWVVFLSATLVTSMAKYLQAPKFTEGRHTANYANYITFSNAAKHLAAGQNLYQAWPEEQVSAYLYSPTFAALMWPLSQLPDVVGLCIWTLSGSALLLWSLRSLPLSNSAAALVAWLVVKDLLSSVQNSQSNALVAALMILAVVGWERRWPALAAAAIVLSFYVKVYGAAVLILWILYPQKLRTVLWLPAIGLALAFLPLAFTSPELLGGQYERWFARLMTNHELFDGESVIGLLSAWFGLSGHKLWTVMAGGAFLLCPLIRVKEYAHQGFRLAMLSSVLMWIVLFNHKAESNTYIIAACGAAIWYATRPFTWTNTILISAMLLVGLTSTDLVPNWVAERWLVPYQIKVVPYLVIWVKMQADLWTREYGALGETPTRAKLSGVASLESLSASPAAP